MLLDASDGGRATAHTVVENRVAIVGIGANKVAEQFNGFLGWVEIALYFLLKIYDGTRIFLIRDIVFGFPEMTVATICLFAFLLSSAVIALMRFAFIHLRVVYWKFFVENKYIFVAS